ncbi:MAG TPA: hypothetical protein PK014_05200 [Thermoanaerobaculia bacterium]|nr:hypothetical protein [Thermoanaerobaculia bacterium]HUM28780.1 hypothetical protein [Thermoanaerobaculia bacterium]HXK67970.1 hypothetical protein [Thermoanaerobaculia bacterium]
MEIPAKVMIFNRVYDNLNGQPGVLQSIHDAGLYEIQVKFRDRQHTVLLPVSQTVLIYQEPMMEVAEVVDIEP